MATDVTLESLAERVERLEAMMRQVRGILPVKDWRNVVGMFADSEFMKRVDEEGRKIREADRQEPLP